MPVAIQSIRTPLTYACGVYILVRVAFSDRAELLLRNLGARRFFRRGSKNERKEEVP